MEAIGEGAADHTAGQAVTPGLSAAALLRGRRLRSVPASDGGAAAGFGAAGFGTVGVGTAGGDAMTTGASDCLERCLVLLAAAVEAAPGELAFAGFRDAADFAGRAEEISRRVEHVQLLAAAAVDRTRTEAINAAGPASKAAGWTTGWGNESEPAATGWGNGPDDGTGWGTGSGDGGDDG